MSHNGRKTLGQVPTEPACHSCGKTVNLQRDNVLVELTDDPWSYNKSTIVWHQDCYDQFLDEGEES